MHTGFKVCVIKKQVCLTSRPTPMNFHFTLHTGVVVSVHDADCEHGAVAVGSERDLVQGGEVVHEVEFGTCLLVKAGHQQVHHVRGLHRSYVTFVFHNYASYFTSF